MIYVIKDTHTDTVIGVTQDFDIMVDMVIDIYEMGEIEYLAGDIDYEDEWTVEKINREFNRIQIEEYVDGKLYI